MSTVRTRRIVLVRHAKSERSDVIDDHERPLAERGRRDAPAAGRWLAGAGITPDLALVSTATRTRETWDLLAPELSERPGTVYEERIYAASPGELLVLFTELSEEVDDVVMVGHNPGIHALAEILVGASEGDLTARMSAAFPTSAIAVLTYEGSWKAVEPGAARLVAFWTPRS
ncbi:histidine phosphatase family protein [Kitasatospora sp. NPDC056181]|uniref:SixA phosphatase family protein n=1 Tax=Kitasatospora sp. NPDC056181 TaxID=3345737 RepID=UPI0035DBBAC7